MNPESQFHFFSLHTLLAFSPRWSRPDVSCHCTNTSILFPYVLRHS
jgi:hypothetical protein